MKKIICLATVGLLLSVGTSFATDMELTITRTDCHPLFPMTATFEVSALLSSDVDNEGLGAYMFDLSVTKGGSPYALSGGEVTAPDDVALEPFTVDGLTNPDGYGGTLIDGVLVQVGAAQNTIANPGPNPPFPTGPVVFGIGHTDAVVIAEISVLLTDADTYEFTVSNGYGTAIDQDETGPDAVSVSLLGTVTGGSATAAEPACPWDLNGDGLVGPADIQAVIANFGCLPGEGDCECDEVDFTGDDVVNPADIQSVIANFGPC